LYFRLIEFSPVWRHFLSVVGDPINGRDGFMRDLADSTREYLSGAIWWLTFCGARGGWSNLVLPNAAGTALCRVGCALETKY
jgi:hypothetical protein